MYNCSSANLNTIPTSAPNFTNWVILENNNINRFSGFRSYLTEVQFLHLGGNMISTVNYSFLINSENSKKITWLNLSRNKLKTLPSKIQNLNYFEKVWLSGNPFHCDCSMLWMISWLDNFTTSNGRHIIVDYKNVRCHSGTAVGTPIYKLNEIVLGCYPKGLTTWQKILIGTGSGTGGLVILILLFLIIKRSRTLQFFIFYRLNIKSILGIQKEDENVKDKKYDAFLSYRFEFFFISEV